jgi:hypothetical protein
VKPHKHVIILTRVAIQAYTNGANKLKRVLPGNISFRSGGAPAQVMLLVRNFYCINSDHVLILQHAHVNYEIRIRRASFRDAPRITALIKRGLPVEASGKIDLEAAEAWLRSNGVPQARFGDRGVSRVVGGPSPPLTPSPVPPASVSTASTPAPKRQPDKTAEELPVISQEPGIEESEF